MLHRAQLIGCEMYSVAGKAARGSREAFFAAAIVLQTATGSSFAGEFTKDLHFALPVGSAVGMEDVVKPNHGLHENIRTLPRVPR